MRVKKYSSCKVASAPEKTGRRGRGCDETKLSTHRLRGIAIVRTVVNEWYKGNKIKKKITDRARNRQINGSTLSKVREGRTRKPKLNGNGSQSRAQQCGQRKRAQERAQKPGRKMSLGNPRHAFLIRCAVSVVFDESARKIHSPGCEGKGDHQGNVVIEAILPRESPLPSCVPRSAQNHNWIYRGVNVLRLQNSCQGFSVRILLTPKHETSHHDTPPLPLEMSSIKQTGRTVGVLNEKCLFNLCPMYPSKKEDYNMSVLMSGKALAIS